MYLLTPLLFILSFIQVAFARRGSGGGGFQNGTAPANAGVRGNRNNSDFELESFGAALFALSIIFAIITAVQTLWLLVQNRKSKKGRFIVIETGRIFPISFFLSLLSLLATYIFRAVFTGILFNTRRRSNPSVSDDSTSAWAAINYLSDILLILAIFSFISTRYKSLPQAPAHLPQPKTTTNHLWIKHAFDGIIILALISLAAAYIGLRTELINRVDGRAQQNFWVFTLTRSEIVTLINLMRAYWVIMLIAVISIGISALLVYARARKVGSHVDTKAMFYIMTILTPSYILYILFQIIFHEVYNPRVNGRLNNTVVVNQLARAGLMTRPDWDLAGLIISGITKILIISVCLYVRNLRSGTSGGGDRELNDDGKKVDVD